MPACDLPWSKELLDDLSVGALVTDSRRRICYANAAFCRMSGYELAELSGNTPRILQSGHTPRALYERLHQNILQGLPWSGVLLNRHRNGRLYRQSLTISPVRQGIESEPGFYIGFARRLPNAERSARADTRREKLLRQMGAGIAHNYNNMLTCVAGNVFLAAQDLPAGDCVRERLGRISEVCESMAAATSRFSIATGVFSILPEPINIADLIEEVRSRFYGRSDSESLSLEVQIPPADAFLTGDRELLPLMLTELLANAAESYSGEQGRICLAATPADGDTVRISVRDNGCGIARTVRGRVFEPFYTTQFVGRGLGLPIAANIARAHGGSLTLSSSPQKGTAVRISLPLTYSAQSNVSRKT